VNSFVSDVVMPPVGLLLGNVDFSNLFWILKDGTVTPPYASLAEAKKAGAVTLNIGLFVNTMLSFFIIAFSVFLVVRTVNRLKRQQEPASATPATKECPYCLSAIPVKAFRCGHCTSDLKG